MNVLQQLVNAPLVDRLGWTLLHFVWEGALVALGLGLTLLRRGSPQGRYAAGLGAMVMLLVLPMMTFIVLPQKAGAPELSASKVLAVPPALGPAISTALKTEPGATTPEVIAGNSSGVPRTPQPAFSALPIHDAVPARIELRDTSISLAQRLMMALSAASPWLVPGWLLGVVVLSLWNLGAYAAVQRLKSRTTRRVDGVLNGVVERIGAALGLRRAVEILQTERGDSPLVIGFLKPAILMPVALLTELPPAQLEALLAHELAHICRHDYLVNLLQTIVETLLFYHPAVWWISRRIRIERELCCDDLAVAVIKDRMTYVRALAAVADLRAPALAPAASGGVLLPRLRRVLGLPSQDALQPSRWLAGLIILAALVVVGTTMQGRVHAADEPARHPVGYVDPAHPYEKHRFHFVGNGECVLSGRVIDAKGIPVNGATVYFGNEAIKSTGMGQPAPTWVRNFRGPAQVTSDADGRFSFNLMYPGRTDIWADTATSAGWTRDLDSDAKDVTIQLAPKGDTFTYDGTLFDMDGKTPVSGARVVVVQDANDSILSETKTDVSGHYHLQLKPPFGSFHHLRLVCIAPERAIAWFTVPYCSGSGIDLQLKKQTTFTGRVVNEAGSAVAGASMRVYIVLDRQYGYLEGMNGAATIMPTASTDKDGWFTLKGIPQDSSVGIQVLHPEYRRYSNQDVEALQVEQELPDIRLAEGAIIEGTVYLLTHDKPMEGAKVTLDYPVSPPKTTTTDKDGRYRFSGVDDGTGGSQQYISAEAGGTPILWEAKTYYETKILPGDHVKIDLTLERSTASLQAEWKAKPGKPLASQFNVAILDDADPGYSGKAVYDDTLTLRDSIGKVIWQKKGINIAQNIGGGHPVAADSQRKSLWLCESVGKRLLKYSSDGSLVFEKPEIKANSIALDPKTGNAWVLTSTGTIYGSRLLVFSPEGDRLHDWDLNGYDIVYSSHDDCFWTVGKTFQKIDREGKVIFSSPTNFSWVAMSVSVNETDGSIWIAEGRHPNVMESRGLIWIINSDGQLRKTFSVDMDNRCVVVDGPRQTAWIAGRNKLSKVDLEGKVLAQIPLAASECVVEPDTGYVWCGSFRGGLWRLDTAGALVWNTETVGSSWVAFLPR